MWEGFLPGNIIIEIKRKLAILIYAMGYCQNYVQHVKHSLIYRVIYSLKKYLWKLITMYFTSVS